MPARILIVNIHSCQNAGDAALMLSAAQLLRRHFPGCQLTLVMNDPASYQGDEPVLSSLVTWLKRTDAAGQAHWRFWAVPGLGLSLLLLWASRWLGPGLLAALPRGRRALLRAYAEADLVVGCPGGYLFSSGQLGLSLVMAVIMLAAGLLAGKPLYLLPQSIGPLRPGFDRWLVGALLKRARLIMVREAISLEQLPASPAVRRRVSQVPDLALLFEAAPRAAAVKWLAEAGWRLQPEQPILGLTAINWQAQTRAFPAQAQYEQALAAAARYFVEQQHGRVIFFPQVCGPTADQDDRVPALRVAAQLADLGARVKVVQAPLPPELLKAVYGLMDVFIGTRMHSSIFAVGNAVPVLAIGYQFKTLGIARTLGIEAWVLDIQTVDSERLVAGLARLWSARAAVSTALRQRLPALLAEAELAGAHVAADFDQWQTSHSR